MVNTAPTISDNQHVDWGEAPESGKFYGRQKELSQLKGWIIRENCRLIALVGIGGIGKTALSVKLAIQVEKRFTHIIWRSLKNSPPLDEVLMEWIKFLSDQSQLDLPESFESKLSLLLTYLRKHRCLLILDNVESILREGDLAGYYREGYEGYGRLIQFIGEKVHQSSLLVTTREKLKELVSLEERTGPVRSLLLQGLGEADSRKMLMGKDLVGTEEVWNTLIHHYAGNPLALKLVAEPIQVLFNGDINAFLRDGVSLFDDLYKLLKQQFTRLSELEKEIMYWLAIDRDVVTPEDLLKDIVHLSGLSKDILYWLAIDREETSVEEILHDIIRPVSKREILEELASLRRRALIEMAQTNFTLQPVIMEYTTERFVDKIFEEIITGKITLFASHAIIKAQAKEYIRNSQVRMILTPLIDRLITSYREKGTIEERFSHIIARLRAKTPRAPGYVGGNSLNLLCQLQRTISQYDFSNMTINQAYLQDVELHDVNFTGAHFENTVFTETFGSIFSVAFSPNGQFLAAGSVGGEIRVWQIEDATQLKTMSYTNLLWSVSDKSDDWVWSVAFSPDGNILASGNDNNTIKLWNASKGECLKTLQGHTDRVWSVVFNPDGTTLASASDDHTVKIWHVRTGEMLKTLQGHTDRVVSVSFNIDGTILASGSEDHTIKLWDVHAGTCLNTLSGHTSIVWSVAFSPDGILLVSSSEDQTVRIWDIRNAQTLKTLQGHANLVWSVAFSPNGILLASGSEDQTLRLWDAYTGQCMKILQGYTNQVWSVAFSPDGATLASGNEDRTVKVWNSNTRQLLRSLSGHGNRVRSVTFSPNGMLVASGSEDHTVRVWDARTGQCLRVLRQHTNPVWSVDFSNDSRTLASGSDDQTIILWDITTGISMKTLRTPNTAVWSVAFSPDGTLLASGHEDCTIGIWNVVTGSYLRSLQGHTGNVRSVTFSPDGTTLISGSGSADQTAKLWNVNTGECLQTLQGHTNFVKTVAFSPDGSTVATGSDDQTIKLWDTHTYHCLKTFHGHTDSVKSVRFSPVEKILCSGGEDSMVKIWDINIGKCLKTLQSPRPYERMNITRVTGLTEAQKSTLMTLGAFEEVNLH